MLHVHVVQLSCTRATCCVAGPAIDSLSAADYAYARVRVTYGAAVLVHLLGANETEEQVVDGSEAGAGRGRS